MKKLTSILLIAATTVATLAGCGSSSASTEPAGESAEVSVNETDAVSSEAQGSTYDDILANGYITFATEGTYAPYSYHNDADELVGFDVEIARAVADKLGVEARFTETQWDGIIAGLDAGKYDAIANQVSITEERQQKYLFSTPYTYAYGAVVVNEANDDITSFEDLDGKDVALTVTSNWAEVAESYGGSIVATNGFSESIQLVIQQKADATVNDNVTFLDFKANQPDAPVKIVATSDESTQSAILIRKEDAALQEAINGALAELEADGTLTEISVKYFGEDITKEN